MSAINVVEFGTTQLGAIPIATTPPVASQNVTISGTSAQSAALNTATKIIRVCSDVACYIKVGANPTAAAGDHYLPANAPEYLLLESPGAGHKIAAITA